MGTVLISGADKMHDANLTEWVAAAVAVLGLFGGGVRYLVSKMEHRAEAERQWEKQEREKLEAAFTARIDALEKLAHGQRRDILFLQSEVHRHIRHVGVLEGLLRAHEIQVPPMEPPAPIPS